MSRNLKNYLSLEDVNTSEIEIPEQQPVTRDDIYAADSALYEQEADYQAAVLADKNTESAQGEIEDQLVSIENIMDVLEHGIETKQYNTQTAALVAFSMEHYSELLGSGPSVSIEDYTKDNLEEFYVASLEDLTEKAYRIGQAIDRSTIGHVQRLVSGLSKSVKDKQAQALIVKADSLLEKLNSADGSSSEFSVKGLEKRIAVNGTVPSNFLAAAKKDRESFSAVMGVINGSGIGYLNDLDKAADQAVRAIRNKNAEEASNVIEKFATREYPLDKFPAGIQDGAGLIGSVKLEVGDKVASDKAAAKFKALAQRGAPHYVKVKVKTAPSEMTMSKNDIKSLLNLVKEYAGAINQSNQELTKKIGALKLEVALQNRYHRNEGDFFIKLFRKNKEVQAASRLMNTHVSSMGHLATLTFNHGFSSSKAMLSVAERAISGL